MDIDKIKKKGLNTLIPNIPRIAMGMGTCGLGNGTLALYQSCQTLIKKNKIKALLTPTGCFGFCSEEPLINVYIPGHPLLILHRITEKDIEDVVINIGKARPQALKKYTLCKISKWDHYTAQFTYGQGLTGIPEWNEIPFFKWQKKIVLRNCGIINPEDIAEYVATGGYQTLHKVLNKSTPDKIIQELKISKLRGRGGAGFPTWKKWQIMKQAVGDKKYIVCNADEGDPGAYMNRNELESDPHMIIEGMLIGAFAMGAQEGIVYIRAEYPLAVKRLDRALIQARQAGLLGKNIMGSGFDFDIHMVEGAGAFVCGEETALIASVEGRAGRPRPRPPFPAQSGLWTKPTTINNVETWANIPVIIAKGGKWFATTGTTRSAGTKVFSLVGKIKNTGLVELPLGETLNTIIMKIGQGSGEGTRIKAVQTGGPSGGCVPTRLFNTKVDYEALTSLGTIMGSGGIVVMDENNCMVDVAGYFTGFTAAESCGKCVPCREGIYQLEQKINSIKNGNATEDVLQELEDLCLVIKDSALCGLGQTGPNPVLTTLLYFEQEYRQHIVEGHCAAGICESLFNSPCENACPLHMNVPRYIALLKEDRLAQAFFSVIYDNPLPGITGRLCHHPCEMKCRRATFDDAVSIRGIHRYIADQIYIHNEDVKIFSEIKNNILTQTKKKIAIIGGGPAGVTTAFYLRLLGHDVTVYESQAAAGGMIKSAIPEYRIPTDLLKREIKNIESLGIRFKYNHPINTTKRFKKLSDTADAMFIAAGVQHEVLLRIEGEELAGVFGGLELLAAVSQGKKPRLGKKTIVIGGGNTAIDVARTALRLGTEVQIVYRREKGDMPAIKQEIEEAIEEGITINTLAAPVKIIGNGRVTALKVVKMIPGELDASGRRKPMPTDQYYQIPCNSLIFAIGEKSDYQVFSNAGIKTENNGLIKVNYLLQTNKKRVYAGGDIITGAATIIQAIAAGKRAAEIMDFHIMQQNRFNEIFKKFYYRQEIPEAPQQEERQPRAKKLPAAIRINNFNEVNQGLSRKAVKKELLRCLRCDIKEEK